MSAKNAGRRAPVRHLREIPARTGLVVRSGQLTDRTENSCRRPCERSRSSSGDERYTSTVIVDKFEERSPKRLDGQDRGDHRGGAHHKAMVIGDKGERIKRIGMETRVELEKALDCKVFIEMWVKVRSGWADDEARVRSFGYE
jgi:GTP-binding protein Era